MLCSHLGNAYSILNVMFRKIISVVSLARQFVYMYYNWFHKGELRKGDNPYLNKKGSNREIPTLSNPIILFIEYNSILLELLIQLSISKL